MTELNRETVYGLLREIRSVAYEASLTGSLKKGGRVLVDVYNRCLAAISQSDPLASELFPQLTAETSIDEIGVAAALLSRYVRPAGTRRRHDNDDDDDHDEDDED